MSRKSDKCRTAIEAWNALSKEGGLDLDDRDFQLLEILRLRLDPDAADLESALQKVSMEAFLNGLFGVISPFMQMMRDLLQYFENADATSGPEQWTLLLGEGEDRLEVNLDHFRKWIMKEKKGRIMVPDLDYNGFWEMRKCFLVLKQEPDTVFQNYHPPEPSYVEPDFEDWLGAYNGGSYQPLPSVVDQALSVEGPIGNVAAIIKETYSAICNIAKSREELQDKGRWREGLNRGYDFWSVHGLWNFESDYWIGGAVTSLAAWAYSSPQMQAEVEKNLDALFSNLNYREAWIDIKFDDIQSILSLPIWKKRYELYSAWVFSFVLKILDGHKILLHHDNGRIGFAFSETLLATIKSVRPEIKIFSERRVAASGLLKGHGRVSSIQPDYSFWAADVCLLAIECKHYKRSSTRNFSDALNDYAETLKSAQIILANYGPVSEAIQKAIETAHLKQCLPLGYIRPEGETKERANSNTARFKEHVRRIIGEPIKIFNLDRGGVTELLIVDVSGSMRQFITTPEGVELIRSFVDSERIIATAAADNRLLLEAGVTSEDLSRIVHTSGTGGTDLSNAIRTLRGRVHSICVLTDGDGVETLREYRDSIIYQDNVSEGLLMVRMKL